MLGFLRDCVSLVVAVLICLSVFANHALALEQSVVEQSKNNYDLTNSSTNNTKISPDVLKTPHSPPPYQKSILFPDLKASPVLTCNTCNCNQIGNVDPNNPCFKCCQRNRQKGLNR